MKNNLNTISKLLCVTFVSLLMCAKTFSQDTTLPAGKALIVMKDGKRIDNAKLWELQSKILVYEQDGSLHDALISDVEKISMPDANYVFLANNSLENANAEISFADSTQGILAAIPDTFESKNYYRMGYDDAGKYYNGAGAAIGGFFSGFVPGLGWFIAMPIISATQPQMYNANNPNLVKLRDKDYVAGYKKNATHKKLANVFGGFSLGLITFLAMVL